MELREIVELAMMGIGFGAAVWTAFRNREKGRMLESVIVGLEAGVNSLPEDGIKVVKKAIASHSEVNRVAAALDGLVQAYTSKKQGGV